MISVCSKVLSSHGLNRNLFMNYHLKKKRLFFCMNVIIVSNLNAY